MEKKNYTIRRELVGSPVEEWTEFRIYDGNPRDGFHIASFASEAKAKAWIRSRAN